MQNRQDERPRASALLVALLARSERSAMTAAAPQMWSCKTSPLTTIQSF